MSKNITEAFVQQYSAGFEQALQQRTSRLRAAVREESVSGERLSFDSIGAVRMQRREGRNQPIPVANAPHFRRWLSNSPFHIGDYVDGFDKLKVLTDPTNAYTEAFSSAGAREIDKIIVDAALGDAYTGKEGTTKVSLPANRIIAAGATGMTFEKIKTGVQMLRTSMALQDGDEVHVAWNAIQESGFVDQDKVANSLYTTVKVIDNGGVEKFYRCNFHAIEDLIEEHQDGSETVHRILPWAANTRTCLMWIKSGILLNVPKEAKAEVNYIPEKGSYFVSASMVAGAVRMHERKVVAIQCQETEA